MYLTELKLWNFRKFGSLELFENKKEKPDLIVPFQSGLNLLVGENDSGKTAIIDAIKMILLTNSREYLRLSLDDFFCKDDDITEKLRIECHFKFDTQNSKAHNFLEWGHFNDQNEYELCVFVEIEHKDNRVLPYDIRGGIDDEGTILDARARELLSVTYLKPLRDVETELMNRKGSRLSQVLDNHKAFADKDNHFLSDTVKFANDEISNFFKGKNSQHQELYDKIKDLVKGDSILTTSVEDIFKDIISSHDSQKGKEVADQINQYLSSFFGEATASVFKISETSLKGILERLSLHLENNNAGLGSHNLLFIAVELLLLEHDNGYKGLRLALIEEIEAHLHPQAQMRLVTYLQKECSAKKMQMFLTTHSPNLASKVSLKSLIICQGNNAYPMGSDYTALEERDYGFLQRFLDVTKANLFFAKGVLLVEGDAENLLIPTIANLIDCDLTKYGVSIINLGGLTFKYYEKIFIQKDKLPSAQMKVPVAIITDVDTKTWEYYGDSENKAKLDTRYEITQDLVDEVNTAYSDKFENLVFDNKRSVYDNLDGVAAFFRNYLSNNKKRLPNGFSKFLEQKIIPRNIVEQELALIQTNKRIILEKDHQYKINPSIKGFVNNHWTLEYELGLSCLREYFYTAILMAEKLDYYDENELKPCQDNAKKDIDEWKKDGKTEAEIAYEIFWIKMMGRGTNKLSKAIVAQFFAEILDKELNNDLLKEEIKTDKHLEYIVRAIKHTTQKN
jgi:putative ATP-dependent endonuclease of OLD family